MPRAFFTFFVIDGNKTVKDENGNWVLAPDESEAIAVYNGKGYMSLQSAIDAAGSSPANVSLVGNTTEAVTIRAGADITLDIAEGVTLTGTDSDHVITNNGTLTVTGKGTVVAIATNKAAVENTGVVNLKGGNFTRNVGKENYYVLDNQGTMNISDTANVYAEAPNASLIRNLGTSLEQKATLNISGGVITQNTFIAVKNDDYGVLNITGGTITSAEQAVQNWHKATITGGTISGPVISWAYDDKAGMDNTLDISGTAVVIGDVKAVNYEGSAVPHVTITGGTVKGLLVKGRYDSGIKGIQPLPNDSEKADIVVSGGTFNQDVTDFVIDGNKTVDDGNGNWVLAPDEAKAIAVYNGKGYMTLKEALDAAGNGPANVSLTNDTAESVTIPATANITIDIAEGVTLTGTDSDHVITNYGTLTVTGEGTVKAIASSKGAVENFGTAYLKGAKFRRDVYQTGGNWYVLDNQGTMNISDTASVYAEAPDASLIRNLGTSLDQKATLNISGGVITQNTFIAVKNDDYGVLNITGGTITSAEQAVQNWHKATITGGTISGPVISWAYDDKAGMDNTLDISGTAVVIGDVKAVNYEGSAVPHVTITGGTVKGSLVKGLYDSVLQTLPNDSDQADIVVSGGTFNNAVPEEFCAENFHPNRNPDGSYSVHTHQFGPWVTTVRPGHTTSGTEVQTCTVCGYEIARTIAPTGNNDHPDIEQAKQDGTWGQEETSTPAPTATAAPAAGSVNTVPQTGDEMPLAVLGGAAALAAAAMVVLILRKRRVF